MISGIFSAVFASNQNSGGTGVAIFSGNAIYGGDTSFYYRGKYKLDDKNRISGTLDIVKHSDLLNSVFGPVDKFRLILNGVVNSEGFELSGQIDGQPSKIIMIVLKKVDELVEA